MKQVAVLVREANMGDGWLARSLQAEFGGILDATLIFQALVRLLLATGLAAVLGWERERGRKPAGLRTHMLVALGASLTMVAAIQSGLPDKELGRVIQGVILGIGFIGGGTILKDSHEQQAHGLTTAAGIWMTATIGIAAGLGRPGLACFGTLLAWIILSLVQRIEDVAVPRDDQPSSKN